MLSFYTFTSSLIFLQIVPSILAQLNNVEQIDMGSFVIDSPTADNSTLVAGNVLNFKWHTIPESMVRPQLVSVSLTSNETSNLKWELATDIPNRNAFEWIIPTNWTEGSYILDVKSRQNQLFKPSQSILRIIQLKNVTNTTSTKPKVTFPIDDSSGNELRASLLAVSLAFISLIL